MAFRKKSLGACIAKIFRLQRLAAEPRAHALGIRESQIPFLAFILESPGINQDELSRQYFIDKGATARQTAKLEEQGLIERVVDPDNRRKKRLYPTSKALTLGPDFYGMLDGLNDTFLAGFSEAEKEQLLLLLDKVSVNMLKPSINE
ncbi:MarR family winged helix-turn-helix transcriptional regulator [Desulfotalea psychrophila]|uniref:Related to transcriptional regulator n=1 Tax=Desulfotalea psychrophila (strain LSv54 / DSM 12343) TaxID=177439 RepID=Q6AM34_DESPS|nr:MarR family winged helix-turn-helix transcriptional regulator [Desulfotalea psychrophila]CAG36591.1 related to transcriptional regulator [Desulfotalea psychrophila LSv54]